MPNQTQDIIHIVDDNLRNGFAQVPRPVLKAKGLSVKAKLVYITLLDYAWRDGSCFPGQPQLADDLDVSVDSIQRALSELKTYKLVDWKRQGLNRPNIYYILRLSDNPNLSLTDVGNRNLRFPETAGLRLQETANSGSNNTQRKILKEHHHHHRTSSSPQPPAEESSPVDDDVVKTLKDFGVSPKVALRLVASHPPDGILLKLQFTQHLVEKRSPLVAKNPAGFLIKAIEDDYPPPRGYTTAKKREEDAAAHTLILEDERQKRAEAEATFTRERAAQQEAVEQLYAPRPISGTALTTAVVWQAVKDELKKQVSPANFSAWISTTQLIDCDAGAVIACHTSYQAEIVSRRFGREIAGALSTIIGRSLDCTYLTYSELPQRNGHAPALIEMIAHQPRRGRPRSKPLPN